MLFDLRARGRQRAVKGIYLFLAVLMGGGLILFGIGGATSGGLLDAFKGNSTSTTDIFKKRVNQAEHQVRVHPSDPNAWANLTRVRFESASSGAGFDQTKGYTAKGVQDLRGAEAAWNRYTKLAPNPNPDVARVMVNAFIALNEPDKAVTAQELVMQKGQPTAMQYVQLAALAYGAEQTRKAEEASKKAMQLAPVDDRPNIQAALESARTQASAQIQAEKNNPGAQLPGGGPLGNLFGGGG